MEKKRKYRRKFTTSLDPDLLDEIKSLAVRQKLPLCRVLEQAVRDLLKKYEKQGKR